MRQYLGDGVYIERNDYGVKLSTKSGQLIYLNFNTVAALKDYLADTTYKKPATSASNYELFKTS